MRSRSAIAFASASVFVLAACGGGGLREKSPAPTVTSATAPHGKPKIGSFGVDLAGRDPTKKPGDDFYAYASGQWKKDHSIPADKSRWGVFEQLREEADAHVHEIVEEQARSKHAKGTSAQKIGDYYAAYLDLTAIDAKGLAPARPALDAIAAARTHEDIVALMGRADLPLEAPIAMDVSLDQKNPDRYAVIVEQAGLGLPEREYYSRTEPQFEEIRAKYQAHIARILGLAGDASAKDHAKTIFELERRIAERHWPIAERREREKTYNPRTIADLEREAPSFPWRAYLRAQGFDAEKQVIVHEDTAIPKLAKLFSETPVESWKVYLTYHFLRGSADVLPSALYDEVFDFVGRTLSGQPQPRERWKRAVSSVNSSLGDAVGELYVARYFPPRAKAQMEELVENLRKAFAVRIESVSWMTPETKRVALEKLAAFRPKIGYPVKWKDYRSLEVVPGDAFGNVARANVFEHERMRAKLGHPTDRDEWFMRPQIVNAYYQATFNEVVFPAAILQPPFFDPDADPAVNYGAIGGAIGHEMGHGFDDQGAKSDAKGVLRTWWGPADIAAFKQRTDALAEQYSKFELLPGIRVNGRLTLGENIGDLGGLTVANEAYRISLDGKPAPVLEGYTGEQRFFLSWAQVWRDLYRDEALRNQLMTNEHSPSMVRVNGVVRNMPAWYSAFDVKQGDALYLAPGERVSIW